MLNVYIRREDIDSNTEIIDKNDIIFNYDLHNNMKVNSLIKRIMKDIDGAEYVSEMDMRSRYGNITSMENLSTGCKTVINIINHPEAVINCIECGNNILHKILQLNEGNVLFYFMPSNADEHININVIIRKENKILNNLSSFLYLVDLYNIE